MKTHKDLENKCNNLINVDKVIWKQKRRAVWLKDGDWNTSSLHGKAEQLRKKTQSKKSEMRMGVGG